MKQYIEEYLTFRDKIDQVSEKTINLNRNWLLYLQRWVDNRDFSKVAEYDPGFLEYVRDMEYSYSYKKKIILTAKTFFKWLNLHHSYEIPAWWIASMKPPRNKEFKEHEAVSLEEIKYIAKAPVKSKRDRRIRASAVFLWLSGARIRAFLSLPIKAIDIENKTIYQWPEYGVQTKNGKKATTFLLNVPELYPVIEEWDHDLKHLPADSIWFANFNTNTNQELLPAYYNSGKYARARNDLQSWLESIGMPYYSPHKFRHGHAVYALKQAKDMAQFKAISQNLMHNSVTTTDSIYSIFSEDEVKTQLMNLGHEQGEDFLENLAEAIAQKLLR